MVDSVSVKSHNSYGSRVSNSFKAIGGGFIAVIIAVCLLFWNENNYVDTKNAYEEGAKIVQEVDVKNIDSALDESLVHVVGLVESSSPELVDSEFGVRSDDLKLSRNVEMYQWDEDKSETCTDNYGGSEDCTTTYDYKKVWSDEEIDSSGFYSASTHENPSWNYESQEYSKETIKMGEFTLGGSFVNQINADKTLSLQNQQLAVSIYKDNRNSVEVVDESENTETEVVKADAIACTDEQKLATNCNLNIEPVCGSDGVTYDNACFACVKSTVESYTDGSCEDVIAGQEVVQVQQPTQKSTDKKVHVYNNYIYIGEDPSEPSIGDYKITFTTAPEGKMSIIGKQYQDTLDSYRATNGKHIALLEKGTVSAEDMFANAQSANEMFTRIIRLIGLLVMYCGFAAMLRFIEILAKVLPPLATVIGWGTGLISFVFTLVLGLGTIAVAWLYARPLIGIALLAIVIACVVFIVKSKKSANLKTPFIESPETESK